MLEKCMYTVEGLHHPNFKSLVSAKKKIWFTAVVHSAMRILNLNNLANGNRIRNFLKSKQGPKWGLLMNKTREQKSHATVHLK
jgi:hypothetical protein